MRAPDSGRDSPFTPVGGRIALTAAFCGSGLAKVVNFGRAAAISTLLAMLRAQSHPMHAESPGPIPNAPVFRGA